MDLQTALDTLEEISQIHSEYVVRSGHFHIGIKGKLPDIKSCKGCRMTWPCAERQIIDEARRGSR